MTLNIVRVAGDPACHPGGFACGKHLDLTNWLGAQGGHA